MVMPSPRIATEKADPKIDVVEKAMSVLTAPIRTRAAMNVRVAKATSAAYRIRTGTDAMGTEENAEVAIRKPSSSPPPKTVSYTHLTLPTICSV